MSCLNYGCVNVIPVLYWLLYIEVQDLVAFCCNDGLILDQHQIHQVA